MRWVAPLFAVMFAAAVLPVERRGSEGFRLVPPVKHEKLIRSIPETDDPLIESIRTDPRLLVFTKDEVPPVFQAADNNRSSNHLGVFAAGTSFVVGGVTVGGGSNQFPWRTPAGLDDATGWDSFQFLWLPEGKPIEWGRQALPGDRGPTRSITWTYPPGTVFGEVLGVVETAGSDPLPFEMRVRRKLESGEWRIAVFRPYSTREELDLAVALSGSPQAERFVGKRVSKRFQFSNQLFTPLEQPVEVDFLPELDPVTVRNLLSGIFTSVRGGEWVEGGFAPTVDRGFHIVPARYFGAGIRPAEGTCTACHRTAGANISRFGMPTPTNWDEWVRGNGADQSMTWHPFASSSISRNGAFLPVVIRNDLIEAGILRRRVNE